MQSKTYKSLFIFFMSVCLTVIPLSVEAQQQARGPAQNNNTRLEYHNGPVMTGTSHVYFIWYGDWSGNTAQQILPEIATTLGGSSYFRINTTYPEGGGATPSGSVLYSGAVTDLYSHGHALNEAVIEEIISNLILNGGLPFDSYGIYVVLSAADVDFAGFDSGRCQFHQKFVLLGGQVRYALVGNSARNPEACASQFVGTNGQLLSTPNNNLGADAMASWMVHAINGTITNPTGLGWYDRNGLENSDKCVGSFGQTYIALNGARANITLAGRDYLIQQNWVNDRKGRCALGY